MSTTPQAAKTVTPVYGERALHRLEIATRLLRRRDLSRDRLGEQFAPAVLEVVCSLGAEQRERLRAQVDWVEAYERAEARWTSSHSRGARWGGAKITAKGRSP